MDIKSLAQLGRIEKEIEVNKELRVKVHTLSTLESQKALSSIPESIENVVARFAFVQSAMLAQATDEVNGQAVTKEEARELYDNMQYTMLQEIYTVFNELSGDQAKVMEELKKK